MVRSGGNSGKCNSAVYDRAAVCGTLVQCTGCEVVHQAAEQECPEAQYELGVCYEAGDGVGKDEAKAAELYRKAAVQGYAEAQKKLGDCYTHGIGVAKDLEQAFECYSKAAKRQCESAVQSGPLHI